MEDIRVTRINRFTAGVADLQITRHPLRSEVILVFNNTTYDIYRDATTVEEARINKRVIVEKDKDLFYIQELVGEEFLIDSEEINPWVVIMTTTGLTRTPKQDDNIIIDGVKFTIARVKPINKRVSSVLNVIVYPERTDYIDELQIQKVNIFVSNSYVDSANYFTIDCNPIDDEFIYDLDTVDFTPDGTIDAGSAETVEVSELVVLEIIYGGNPIEMSLDAVNWIPFKTRFKFKPDEEPPLTLFIRDAELLQTSLPL